MNGQYLKIALAQLNFCVGDIERNSEKIKKYIKKAQQQECDIVCFPELSVTGYPPEDLLLNPSFISKNINAINDIIKHTKYITSIIGFVDSYNKNIYNSAAVISDRKLIHTYHKSRLPNYGVFDEKRYFEPGNAFPVYRLGKLRFGVNICEDIWFTGNPTEAQSFAGAQLIINISSSPYHASKVQERENMLVRRANDYNTAVIFCNLIGGQDELVFDGHSCVILPESNVVSRAAGFREEFLVASLDLQLLKGYGLNNIKKNAGSKPAKSGNYSIKSINIGPLIKTKGTPGTKTKIVDFLNEYEEIFNALVLGTRDYIVKNGFKKVVIGLSGGIDSSLVAVIAYNTIGPQNVIGVCMPSKYSSEGSIKDAETLAKNLDIKLIKIPINRIYDRYIKDLSVIFKDMPPDVTEENLQARIRGNILMALSNKFNWLVLTTANKSETSVGYTTLYGDMAGGFSVIKDVPKTLVYKIAEYYNKVKSFEVIPHNVLIKPPSAELRPDQKDTDSLPPYEVMDPILKAYVQEDKSLDEIVKSGYSAETVKRIVRMVDRNEYKRRQGPPGIKITPRAFGKDRRFPLTNKYIYR